MQNDVPGSLVVVRQPEPVDLVSIQVDDLNSIRDVAWVITQVVEQIFAEKRDDQSSHVPLQSFRGATSSYKHDIYTLGFHFLVTQKALDEAWRGKFPFSVWIFQNKFACLQNLLPVGHKGLTQGPWNSAPV